MSSCHQICTITHKYKLGENFVKGMLMEMGIGMGIGNGNGNIKITPVPADDSIISQKWK